jgi:hypothetical protein
MAKKTLNEKIKFIGFWTFGGVFWYLVVAFFLKSKYPIFDYSFNADQAYDVIKDALTLAAAFLAPVAAFVLFSDWRGQHFQTKIEKDSQHIDDLVSEINVKLNSLQRIVLREVIIREQLKHYHELNSEIGLRIASLKRKIFEFESQKEFKSTSGRNYIRKVKEVAKYQVKIYGGIRELLTGFQLDEKNQKIYQKHKLYDHYKFEVIYDSLDLIDEDMIHLTAYKAELQINL